LLTHPNFCYNQTKIIGTSSADAQVSMCVCSVTDVQLAHVSMCVCSVTDVQLAKDLPNKSFVKKKIITYSALMLFSEALQFLQ
jgi:hypothetical protein